MAMILPNCMFGGPAAPIATNPMEISSRDAPKITPCLTSVSYTHLQEGLMDRVMHFASIVGLAVVGGMVASMVSVTTPLTFSTGRCV